MSNYQNIAKAKAIEKQNKKRLLAVNPKLDDESGIYILWRTEIHGYVGQSVGILTRLAQHLVGFQHIDLSMKKHGLFSEKNKGGYKIDFIHCPKSELDDKEREYIQKAIDSGWVLKNKTSGGQDDKKEKIADFRPVKGYRDGIKQGKINLARELSSIAEKHLKIEIREDKKNNKVSQRQFEKFKELMNEDSYKEGE